MVDSPILFSHLFVVGSGATNLARNNVINPHIFTTSLMLFSVFIVISRGRVIYIACYGENLKGFSFCEKVLRLNILGFD